MIQDLLRNEQKSSARGRLGPSVDGRAGVGLLPAVPGKMNGPPVSPLRRREEDLLVDETN